MNIKEKVALYIREIENGRFEIINNFIVYKRVSVHAKNVGVCIGDIIGKNRDDANTWQCYATIDGRVIRVAMSIIMFAHHYGIEKVYDKMEIRYKDRNRFNFSKENMIDASYRFGITDGELQNSIVKRIELFLKQIEIGLYYVDDKSGTIYYNATGMNVEKGDVLGHMGNAGYLEYSVNIRCKSNRSCSVRLHQILYAYYNGLENFDVNKVIHHVNEDKLDNKKENLEQISHCENARLSQMSDIKNIDKQLDSRGKIEVVLDRIERGVYRINVNVGEIYYAQKVSHAKRKVGDLVGSISNKGYRYISFRIEGIIYSVALHSVIYYHGNGIDSFDEGAVIHHVDGNKLNNSIKNLRKISHRENSIKGNRLDKSL